MTIQARPLTTCNHYGTLCKQGGPSKHRPVVCCSKLPNAKLVSVTIGIGGLSGPSRLCCPGFAPEPARPARLASLSLFLCALLYCDFVVNTPARVSPLVCSATAMCVYLADYACSSQTAVGASQVRISAASSAWQLPKRRGSKACLASGEASCSTHQPHLCQKR